MGRNNRRFAVGYSACCDAILWRSTEQWCPGAVEAFWTDTATYQRQAQRSCKLCVWIRRYQECCGCSTRRSVIAEAVAKCATAIKSHDSARVLCEAVEQYCCRPRSGGQPVASAATSEAELRAHEAKLAAEIAGMVGSPKGFGGRLISFISNALSSLVS